MAAICQCKVHPKKSVLFQRKVTFLGHILSGDGVRTDPSKTEAVIAWPVYVHVQEFSLSDILLLLFHFGICPHC